MFANSPPLAVKVCGVTCAGDARMAAAAGASAVGMVCHARAPRRIDATRAEQVCAAIPEGVTPVFVFVDAPTAVVREYCAIEPRAWLQFHGGECASECEGHGRPYLKVLRPATRKDVGEAMAEHRNAAGLVCDGGGGGEGKTFDWDLLPPPGERDLPLVLAGGLDTSNVAVAVRQVMPDAVDVSSGVCVPGDKLRKDASLVSALVAAARAAHAPARASA